jgi:hypothetical protein
MRRAMKTVKSLLVVLVALSIAGCSAVQMASAHKPEKAICTVPWFRNSS